MTAEAPSPAKAAALKEVSTVADLIQRSESDLRPLRTRRNKAIIKAAKYAPATEIAAAAGIKQSYVSRVIRSKGKPESGTELDRKAEERKRQTEDEG